MYLVSQHSTGVPPDRLSRQLITIVYFEHCGLDLQRFQQILIFFHTYIL